MTKTDFVNWCASQSWTMAFLSRSTREVVIEELSQWFDTIKEFTEETEETVAEMLRFAGDRSYALFAELDKKGLNNSILYDYYNGDHKLVYTMRGVCDELSLLQDTVVRELGRLGVKNILDFGGGNGRFVLKAATKLPASSITYSDINSVGISFVKFIIKKYGLNNLKTSYEVENNLLKLTDTYDCIVSLDVIEHFMDPEAIIRQLHQHLVPGGYLISLINCHTGADHPTTTALKYAGEIREDRMVLNNGFMHAGNLGRKVKVWKKL